MNYRVGQLLVIKPGYYNQINKDIKKGINDLFLIYSVGPDTMSGSVYNPEGVLDHDRYLVFTIINKANILGIAPDGIYRGVYDKSINSAAYDIEDIDFRLKDSTVYHIYSKDIDYEKDALLAVYYKNTKVDIDAVSNNIDIELEESLFQ